eukprot:532963-Amphidinium_carterae.1
MPRLGQSAPSAEPLTYSAGKGKGKAVGAVEGAAAAKPASAESTDIGAATDGGPSRFCGWTRLNFDSGCGKTVLPVRYATGKDDKDSSTYRTASGEVLADQGSATISCTGDNGLPLRVVGRAAEVHKPLISAASTLKGRLAIMTEAGGVIMRLADAEAKQVEQIMNKAWKADMKRSEPTRRLIPLVQEKGAYNILVKEPNSRVADAGANEAENGGSRSGGSLGASRRLPPARRHQR